MASLLKVTFKGENLNVNFLRNKKVNFSVFKFNSFWKGVNLNPGAYISELVKYIIDCDKSRKPPGISVEAAIATLYAIILEENYSINSDLFFNQLEDAKQRWENHKNHCMNKLMCEIISVALRIPLDKDEMLPIVIIHAASLTSPSRGFESLKYLNYQGAELKFQTPQDMRVKNGKPWIYISKHPMFSQLECGEFGLCYRFIKKYLINSHISGTVADGLRRAMHDLVILIRSGRVAENEYSLLGLIHLMEQLFTRYPVTSYDVLETIIQELEIVQRWPIPYGSAASELIDMLKQEQNTPGSQLRRKIREEWPLIDCFMPLQDYKPLRDFDKASAFIIFDTKESPETMLILNLMIYNRNKQGNRLRQAIENTGLSTPSNFAALYAHVLRINMILYILSLQNEILVSDLSFISGLSAENVFLIYKRILELLEKTESEDIEVARALREEFFFEFLIEMNNLPSDESDPLTQVLFTYLSENTTYIPSLPEHSFFPIDRSETYNSYIEDPLETDSDLTTPRIIENQFTKPKAVQDPLFDIVYRSQDLGSIYYQSPIRIVISGSDRQVHETLRSMVKLIDNHYDMIKNADLRFYIVPIYNIENTISKYIASIDPWYLRHIYIPFARRLWMPRLDINYISKKIKKSERETLRNSTAMELVDRIPLNIEIQPIKWWDDLLQDYLQEANRTYMINIYKIICYTNSLMDYPDEVIPFCQYVDIGIQAAAMKYKNSKENGNERNLSDIIENKNLKYEPLLLKIRAMQADMFGVKTGVFEEATKNIYSLTVSNIPRESECTAPANPTQDWLELTFIEPESAKEKSTFLDKKAGKNSKELQSDINAVTAGLYSQMHVLSVTISNVDHRKVFEMVVDGVMYGPYHSIVIEPYLLEENNFACMPIMTFLDCNK